MPRQEYTALVLGASGLIGSLVVDLLLKNDKYKTVYAVSRKSIQLTHDKLVEVLADYDSIDEKIAGIQIDHLFCCLGTTKKKTPDTLEYYKIDHDYPLKVSAILKEKNCSVVCLVSSIGANLNSNNFYLRLKGEVEDKLAALAIESTNIFQPSLLIGNRNESRFGEDIAKIISPVLNFLMQGKLKNYRSIQASDVASAMVNVALTARSGVFKYKTQEIKTLS